jgi:hypothetical protein
MEFKEREKYDRRKTKLRQDQIMQQLGVSFSFTLKDMKQICGKLVVYLTGKRGNFT